MADDGVDLVRFARTFERFLDRFREVIPPRRSALRDAVSAHLGTDPAGLSSFSERLDPSDHANLQLALDALAADDKDAQLIGLPAELQHFGGFSFAGILTGRFHGPADPAPPEYVNVPIDVGRTLPCLRLGVCLLRRQIRRRGRSRRRVARCSASPPRTRAHERRSPGHPTRTDRAS